MIAENNPVYISLGSKCGVKYQIDKYTNKSQETHFFDWLISSFQSVLDVIGTKDISTKINHTAIINVRKYATYSYFSSFHCLKMLHDIPKIYDNTHVQACIDKYIRRHSRLINLILSNTKLFFIQDNFSHFKKGITEEDTSKFVSLIKSINPHCRFALIVVSDSMKPFKDNVAWIKLSSTHIPRTWEGNHLAWRELWVLCDTIKPLL